MDFKTSNKSNGTLQDLYAKMCEEKGVQPKTVEQLKQEDALKEKEAREAVREWEEMQQEEKERLKSRVRVIKKEKDGVTLKRFGNVNKLTWEQFNMEFEFTDEKRLFAVLTKEAFSLYKKSQDVLSMAVAIFRKVQVAQSKGAGVSHIDMLMLGDYAEQLQKIMGGTTQDAMDLIAETSDTIFGKISTKKNKKVFSKKLSKNKIKLYLCIVKKTKQLWV